ncbi:hypothetical protein HPB47_021849 [Ixodes persulcatus]|uniref:Uncharacterized protein n=1 Tax=Ixodes persulcatus TaxID=34615 RepID=A0AC60QER7_IXOPE|nr:hypothetical protein HPB47_021849 [Ixodes persulcatus]
MLTRDGFMCGHGGHGEAINSMWLTMIFVQALPCLLGAAPTINVAEIPAFQVPASDSHRSDYGSHRQQPSVIVFTTPPASSGSVTSSFAASIKEHPQDFFTSGHGEAINSMWLTMIFVQNRMCYCGAPTPSQEA